MPRSGRTCSGTWRASCSSCRSSSGSRRRTSSTRSASGKAEVWTLTREAARRSSTTALRTTEDGQLHDLQDMELNVGQRSSEITRIAQSISDLHTLFKELAVLVIDQGSILDRIDYNIERVVDQSMEANKQLKKAEDKQKSYRAMKCILALVIINMILTIILTVKSTN
mmetsp:Transcript_30722/g.102280  ORF Transcript_30722/g.102280 Transcript_30722/m.102280 type:complete len:168 (-) Transcript_30722:216-719(-)